METSPKVIVALRKGLSAIAPPVSCSALTVPSKTGRKCLVFRDLGRYNQTNTAAILQTKQLAPRYGLFHSQNALERVRCAGGSRHRRALPHPARPADRAAGRSAHR